MKHEQTNFIESFADLDVPVAPSASGDRVVPGVIVGLIIVALL